LSCSFPKSGLGEWGKVPCACGIEERGPSHEVHAQDDLFTPLVLPKLSMSWNAAKPSLISRWEICESPCARRNNGHAQEDGLSASFMLGSFPEISMRELDQFCACRTEDRELNCILLAFKYSEALELILAFRNIHGRCVKFLVHATSRSVSLGTR
jgi:hypothetical protein